MMESYIYEVRDLYGDVCFRSLRLDRCFNHIEQSSHRHIEDENIDYSIRGFKLDTTDRVGVPVKGKR